MEPVLERDLDDFRPQWHHDARCFQVGTEYYFLEERTSPNIATVGRGRKLCDACPVYVECLIESVMNREAYGIWAGISGWERAKWFKAIDAGEETVESVIEYLLSKAERTRGEKEEIHAEVPRRRTQSRRVG